MTLTDYILVGTLISGATFGTGAWIGYELKKRRYFKEMQTWLDEQTPEHTLQQLQEYQRWIDEQQLFFQTEYTSTENEIKRYKQFLNK
jgi:hypothetical protein